MSEDAPSAVSRDALQERAAIVEWLELTAIICLQHGGQAMADGKDANSAMTDATVALQLMQVARRIQAGKHHDRPKATA